MIKLFDKYVYTFGNYNSSIWAFIQYEKRRVGADMQYRFNYKLYLANKNTGNPTNGSSYSNNLQTKFTLNNQVVWTKNSQSSSSDWSHEYTTEWFAVTKKTVGTVPFKFTIKDTQNSSWCNYSSTTFNLLIDPAGSSLGVINSFDVENNIPITVTKYANYYDQLIVKINNTEIKKINDIDANYNLSFTPEELNLIYNLMTNFNSIQFTFELNTFENSTMQTQIGESSIIYANGNITNANPIFNNFEYNDTNAVTYDLTNDTKTIIKGHSNLTITIDSNNKALAQKGATIKKYQLVVGEKQVEVDYKDEDTINLTINNVDNNVFIVYAIDSRGNSTPVQKSPSKYIVYNPITINKLEFIRDNQIDVTTKMHITGTFSNINFGAVQNEITLSYQYKQTDSSENWTSGTTIIEVTTNGKNYSFEGYISGDEIAGFNSEHSYLIDVKVTDKLSIRNNNNILPSGTPNIAIHKNGVAFGGSYDENLKNALLNYYNTYFLKPILGTIYVENIESKNQFPGWTVGNSINTGNGAINNNANGAISSEYIPVDFSLNNNYFLSGLTSDLRTFVAAYNSNKEFLGRTGANRVNEMLLSNDSFTSGTAQGSGDIAYLLITSYTVTDSVSDITQVNDLETQLEIGVEATKYVEHKKYGNI